MAELLSQSDLKLLAGRISRDDIPSARARLVRVYLCSTGTDSITERDAFLEKVYPRLRSYCRDKHGLEFQIVDLNWGLSPPEMNEQREITKLRRKEIRKCQELSTGPDFIVFLGQKYGPRVLPDVILSEHYDAIQVALRSSKGKHPRNATFLEQCYVLDENNIPSVYVLKNKIDLVPDFADNNEKVRLSAHKKWEELQVELQQIIQKGAELAYLTGSMDSETKERLCASELEIQTLLGTEGNKEPDKRCVLVTRTIADLKNYSQDPLTPDFADVRFDARKKTSEFDTESSNLLLRLKNRVTGLVSESNIIHHDVLWRYEQVIDTKLHHDYLKSVCEQLHCVCTRLIDEGAVSSISGLPEECDEVAEHWRRCCQFSSAFYGLDTTLNTLKHYVAGSSNTPLVVYGASGSRKTKIVSKLALDIQEMLSDPYMVIIRYIGLTIKSADIRQLLRSVCTQVVMATGGLTDHVPSDWKDLVKFFSDVLTSVPSDWRLVIVLDGIERLLPDHESFTLSWLPVSLPSNVKLITTVDHHQHSLLDLLRNNLLPQSPESFLQMTTATPDECEDLLVKILLSNDRCVTSDQRKVLRDALSREPCPLYAELLAHIAKDMSSLTEAGSVQLPGNIEEGAVALLVRLECNHGKTFVSRAFAYLVASSTGLSDCEMEDLLSLDDDVLNEVFVDFHPSIRRIPYIKWLSLKHDVEPFLTCRDVAGVIVTTWQYDSFHDVVIKRYLDDDVILRLVHSNLADYFLGKWAGQNKPVTALSGNRRLPSTYSTDRKVPAQPHTYGGDADDADDNNVKFNKRMYEQVPRHLVLAGRHKEMDSVVLFNYEWLYNKTKALSLQHVLADFALSPDEGAHLVEEALRMCENAIQRDINTMPAELTGHLLPYYMSHPNIRSLIRQCDTDGLKHCATIPNFPYHKVPGGSLKFTLTCPSEMEHFMFQDSDRLLVCKKTEDTNVHTFDLITGELKNTVFCSNGELYATPSGKYFIIVDHVTEKAIKIHEAETGDFLKQIIVMNHIEGDSSLYKKGPMCLTDDRLCMTVTLTNSLLCICDIPSGDVLNIIFLDGRSQVCCMTPDGRQVFCSSNDVLLAYDVYTYQHLLSVPVGNKPSRLVFTRDSLRAFLSNDADTSVTAMHLSAGGVDMTYTAAFEEQMPGDNILDLTVSPDGTLLLVRGSRTLLVEHRDFNNVLAVLRRPEDVPDEFKLPRGHLVELNFTCAEFTKDSECVAAAVFRNVYIWQISSGSLIFILPGPIGLITSMLVSQFRNQVISHVDKSIDIQVWNIDETVKKINTPDKLTDAVAEFQLTMDSSLVFVKCHHSDELGIIDMRTGCMLDLLTHDTAVEDFAISPDGNWVLLSAYPRLTGTAFKLWNTEERRLVMEAGDVTGYCVDMNATNSIVMVTRREKSFKAPYYISVFHFAGPEFHVHSLPQTLQKVRSKPFVTYTDQYLIVHSALDFGDFSTDHTHPCIHILHLEDGTQMSTWDASNMEFEEHLQDILEIRPCRQENGNLVAAVFSCKSRFSDMTEMDRDNHDISRVVHPFGFFLLDVSTRTPTLLCIPFPKPSYGLNDTHLVFAPDCTLCLDNMSNVFHILSGEFIGRVKTRYGPPRALALWGSVVLYYRNTVLHVVRVSDSEVLANCEVHAPVCHVHVCPDERTVLVGCQDGAVLSYTIIDPRLENETPVLGGIPSRKVGNPEMFEVRLRRSWDKLQQNGGLSYSRPASSATSTSGHKLLLERGQTLPRDRAKSDTLVHLAYTSRSCCVM